MHEPRPLIPIFSLCACLLAHAGEAAPRVKSTDSKMAEPIELDIDLVWSCKPWIDNKLMETSKNYI